MHGKCCGCCFGGGRDWAPENGLLWGLVMYLLGIYFENGSTRAITIQAGGIPLCRGR